MVCHYSFAFSATQRHIYLLVEAMAAWCPVKVAAGQSQLSVHSKSVVHQGPYLLGGLSQDWYIWLSLDDSGEEIITVVMLERERQHPPASEKHPGHNISTSHRTLQTPPAPEENGTPSYCSLWMWAQRADAWTYSTDLPSRQHFWPETTALKTKLWGTVDDRRKTTNFVEHQGLRVWLVMTERRRKRMLEIPSICPNAWFRSTNTMPCCTCTHSHW
jgi:hypothetical protein